MCEEARWELTETPLFRFRTCLNLASLLSSPAGNAFRPAAIGRLVDDLGRAFGVDLDGSHVELGAHLMRAGDRIDAHNDARNGSGERVRLLLYVGIDARRLRGGGLNLLRSAEAGDLGVEIVPGHDRAVAFAISSRSFHSVPAIIDGARCSISLSFRARDWAARAASIPLTIEGAPSPVVSLLDRLGAVRVPHVSSHAGRWKARSLRQPLRNHLCATRIVLERWGCDEPVCLAGLCHGLYGPPGVDTALLSPNQRSVLRRVVGREAENLVFLHSMFDRARERANGASIASESLADGRVLSIDRSVWARMYLISWASLCAQAPYIELSPAAAAELRARIKFNDCLHPARSCGRARSARERIE